MMRALYSGVSGLRTHQTKMDVIGNNIANVNTTAYKSMSINFSDLMYQTTQAATGPNAETGTAGTNPRQIGLGVQTAAISTKITEEGATQSTGNPFDLKISGDEFFVVSNGVDTFFTRDGSFYVDAAGNLAMSSTGYNVMGWQVDEKTMNIKKDTVTPLQIMGVEHESYGAEYTQSATAGGILDWNDDDQGEATGKMMNLQIYDNLGFSYTVKMSLHNAYHETGTDYSYYVEMEDIVDATGKSIIENIKSADTNNDGKVSEEEKQAVLDKLLGAQQPTKVQEEYGMAVSTTTIGTTSYACYTVDVGGTETQCRVKIKGDAKSNDSLFVIDQATQKYVLNPNVANTGIPLYDEKGKALMDANNNPITQSIGEVVDKVYGGNISYQQARNAELLEEGNKLLVTEKNVSGVVLTYKGTDGSLETVAGGGGDNDKSATLDLSSLGEAFTKINIDFSKTLVSDNKGKSTISIEKGDVEGLESGRSLGTIQGVSIGTNGMIYASYSNGQKKLLGQIAVAEFANASGLQKEGNNLYSATQNSGDFDGIGIDITQNGDCMNTGVLEMSNVDLSSEFTEMITTQRGFQANSRIITVSDTMLEELVNLKR